MTDKAFLLEAIALAEKSREPVGCGVVIVKNNKIIAAEFNSQRQDNVAINHAEIKAIVSANKKTKSRKLTNAVAYCSCEPCVMCLSAFSFANVKKIIFCSTMKEMFPIDPLSKINSKDFLEKLNFVPEIKQISSF